VAVALLVPAARDHPAGITGVPTLIARFALPLGLVLAGCLAAGALIAVSRDRRAWLRGTLAATLVAVAAAGLLRLGLDGVEGAEWAATRGVSSEPVGAGAFGVTPGSLRGARWLRAHSAPDDIVATNIHCRTLRDGDCDNTQFWVAAFAERRVLVEGWGFTARNNAAFRAGTGHSPLYLPFWDRERLAANDAVFRHPTRENLAYLRDRWNVRWLFVHTRGGGRADPRLDDLADLRWRSAQARVYELRP
jgi:hypothetical protein